MIDAETAERWLEEREGDALDPGTEVIDRADVRIRISPYAFPWAAVVRGARWSEADADRGIDEVLELFRARRRRFVWMVGPSSRPSDLADRLQARGFGRDVDDDERIMVARLPVSGLAQNSGVRIVEVTDASTLRDGVGLYGRWADEMYRQRLAYLQIPDRRSGFLVAYLDGMPAGAAGWTDVRDGSAVLLNGGTVRPDVRRRGVYSEMTRWRTERALARGRRYAALIADPETSAPILRKRGFHEVGRMSIWYSPVL